MVKILADQNVMENDTTELLVDEEELDYLELSYCSIFGNRESQQDSLGYEIKSGAFLGAVFDGMGGMNGGELASSCSCRLMLGEFAREAPLHNVPGFFNNTIKWLNKEVASLKDREGKPLRGGTTAAAVHINRQKMYWASVGDSRIYVIRDGRMYPITRDHNYLLLLNQYKREGTITEEEYKKELPRGEALISFLGGNIKVIDVDEEGIILKDQDIVLLCTDGLYKAFSDEQILNLVVLFKDEFGMLAPQMTKAVMEYGEGALDNCSILAVKYIEI